MKRFFNSIFGASNKEIKGLSLFILVLVIILIGLKTRNTLKGRNELYRSEDARILDSLVLALENEHSEKKITPSIVGEAFPFDPNTASVEDFKKLGFDKFLAKRIENYRNKGGVFKVKKDLYKIYDIDSALIDSLYRYISLPEKLKRKEKAFVKEEDKVRTATRAAIQKKKYELPDFDINKADTTMLQTINGIGSVLSQRIVDFRDKLGGIVKQEQLYEVYNLDSAVVERLLDKIFIENNFTPRPLKINELSEEELAGHPYISWKQARLIASYRKQHGFFTSEEDLLRVYSVDESLIKKIRPYLSWKPAN